MLQSISQWLNLLNDMSSLTGFRIRKGEMNLQSNPVIQIPPKIDERKKSKIGKSHLEIEECQIVETPAQLEI